MPDLKEYRLFISHAWKYDDDYYRLENLLKNASNLKFANYSVPQHDGLVEKDEQVRKEKLKVMLVNQIRPVNAVLVISGMYAAHSDWITFEIEAANQMEKPIIGITPRGQEHIPKVVSDAAITMVGWNTDSIVQAIRYYAI